jgi:predicted Zn-dependent peptidase
LTVRRKKSLEQVQVCLGVPAYPASSTRRYALSILNYLLGGGASSRLFQTIREDRGLAYSIFSDVSPYTDAGMLCVYAGTSREALPTVLRLTVEEFARLKRDPIPGEELARAKDHLKGSLLLGLETSGARMSHLARQELYFKQFFTIEELSAAIDRVTAEEIQQLCRDLFSPERIAVAALGDLDGFHLSRSLLEC